MHMSIASYTNFIFFSVNGRFPKTEFEPFCQFGSLLRSITRKQYDAEKRHTHPWHVLYRTSSIGRGRRVVRPIDRSYNYTNIWHLAHASNVTATNSKRCHILFPSAKRFRPKTYPLDTECTPFSERRVRFASGNAVRHAGGSGSGLYLL